MPRKLASNPIFMIGNPRIWFRSERTKRSHAVNSALDSSRPHWATAWLWDLGISLLASGAWLSAPGTCKAHFPTVQAGITLTLQEGLAACLVWGFWMQWSVNHVCPRGQERGMAANVPRICHLSPRCLVRVPHQSHPPTHPPTEDSAHSAKHHKTGTSSDCLPAGPVP